MPLTGLVDLFSGSGGLIEGVPPLEKALLKTSDWSAIDGEPCRVTEFTPLAKVENGEVTRLRKGVAYAAVILDSLKLPLKTTGFITHKLDFIHLWQAFNVRGVEANEEVIIFWTRKNYTSFAAKLFSPFMPRLWVMICNQGAYEVMTRQIECADPFFDMPIVSWKPRVME